MVRVSYFRTEPDQEKNAVEAFYDWFQWGRHTLSQARGSTQGTFSILGGRINWMDANKLSEREK